MNQQAKATAMMRFDKIKFDRVLPAHILAGIKAGAEPDKFDSAVMKVVVLFSQNGEPYGASLWLSRIELGLYTHPAVGSSGLKVWPPFVFSPEVAAYLAHAADEAFEIVAPIVTLH